MPETKKFLDSTGTSYLWSKIKTQLDLKASASDVSAIGTRLTTAEGKIDALEAGTYDDTELRGLINDKADTTDLEALSDTVDDLISNDTGKSIRTIANEELAAQLITSNADEALDTLAEIAAWIQNHPDDAATMNSAITTLQGLVGNTAVSSQISTAITNLNLATTYEPIGAENRAKSYADGLATNYATSAQGALANTALQPADVIALTNAEIDAAIVVGSSSGS